MTTTYTERGAASVAIEEALKALGSSVPHGTFAALAAETG